MKVAGVRVSNEESSGQDQESEARGLIGGALKDAEDGLGQRAGRAARWLRKHALAIVVGLVLGFVLGVLVEMQIVASEPFVSAKFALFNHNEQDFEQKGVTPNLTQADAADNYEEDEDFSPYETDSDNENSGDKSERDGNNGEIGRSQETIRTAPYLEFRIENGTVTFHEPNSSVPFHYVSAKRKKDQRGKQWQRVPKKLIRADGNLIRAPTKPRNDGSLLGRPVPRVACKNASLGDYAPAPSNRCLDMNLFFDKGPKVAGSTVGGVARRIALRNELSCPTCTAVDSTKSKEPRVSAGHCQAATVRVMDLSEKDVFKFAMFHEPKHRCVSNYFMLNVGRQNQTATADNLIRYARRHCKNVLFNFYDMGYLPSRQNFDLMGVTSRVDETLVVMANMLGLGIGDLFYKSAKIAHEADLVYGGSKIALSNKAQEFFSSKEWEDNNQLDTYYLRKANEQLDQLIARIGKETFGKQLALFKKHQGIASTKCNLEMQSEVEWEQKDECLYFDNGCQYKCLGRYAAMNNLYSPISNA